MTLVINVLSYPKALKALTISLLFLQILHLHEELRAHVYFLREIFMSSYFLQDLVFTCKGKELEIKLCIQPGTIILVDYYTSIIIPDSTYRVWLVVVFDRVERLRHAGIFLLTKQCLKKTTMNMMS